MLQLRSHALAAVLVGTLTSTSPLAADDVGAPAGEAAADAVGEGTADGEAGPAEASTGDASVSDADSNDAPAAVDDASASSGATPAVEQPGEAPAADAPGALPGASDPGAPPAAPAISASTGPTRGQVGVGLVAAGAAVAASSTVAFTLVEALITPDRDTATISPEQETIASVGGFVSLAAVSVSAIVIVIGAGLAISASGDAAAQ